MKDLFCTICGRTLIPKVEEGGMTLMEPGHCNLNYQGKLCMGKLQWRDSK